MYYYLKPPDSPVKVFIVNQKYRNQKFLWFHTVISPRTVLTNA